MPNFDPEVESLNEGDLIAIGRRISERIMAGGGSIDATVTVDKSLSQVSVANTSGLSVSERRTTLSFQVMASKVWENDVLLSGTSSEVRRLADLDADCKVDRMLERLRWGARVVEAPNRPMPVVFTPEGIIVLFLPLLIGFSGRAVQMGSSPLKGRVGEKVFSAQLTLADDATLPFAPRSAAWDDERVPTRRAVLVDAGVVKGCMYNLRVAAEVDVAPTGHGWKSGIFGGGFRKPPDISPSNWIVSPGSRTLEQILSGLGEALLIDQVIGLGQGRPVSGEFSNTVGVGFLVRRGEVHGRVVNTMIAGNAYEALGQKLIAVAGEPEWMGPLYSPAIAVDAISVTSKE